MSLTTDPNDPRLCHGPETGPTPQCEVYLVLSEEERVKGFVRPLRRSYTHMGPRPPKYPLRDLTAEEHERYAQFGYVRFEEYPEGGKSVGKFWTQSELDNHGCGTVTNMGLELCETYARNPSFYGATYCCGCRRHLPVAEFTWVEDGAVVGS